MKIASPITEENLDLFALNLKANALNHSVYKKYILNVEEGQSHMYSKEGKRQLHVFRHFHFRGHTPTEILNSFREFANSKIGRPFLRLVMLNIAIS